MRIRFAINHRIFHKPRDECSRVAVADEDLDDEDLDLHVVR